MTIYEQQDESLSQAITSSMQLGIEFGERHQHLSHLHHPMSQGAQQGHFEENYMNGNMNMNFPYNGQNQGPMNRQYSYGSSMGDQFNLMNQISQHPHHQAPPFPNYQTGPEYLSSPSSNFLMGSQMSEVSTPSNSSSSDLSTIYYDALFPDHHRASWDASAMSLAAKRHRPYSPRKQSSASEDAESSRPKVYVLKACVSCKASHVACDIARPCQRCVRLNKADTCVDAERKKRGRPCNSGKRQKEAAEKKRRERERELEQLEDCNQTGVPSVLMGRRDEAYHGQQANNNYSSNLQELQDQDEILQMLSYVGIDRSPPNVPPTAMTTPGVAPLIRSFVNGLINSNKVMMFSKETCPFCMRAKDLLEDLDVPYKAYELRFDREDRVVESHEVRRRLIELTKQSTVPNIFVNGKHLGGSSDLIDAHESGKLQKLLETKNPDWVDPNTVKPIPAGWSDIDGKE